MMRNSSNVAVILGVGLGVAFGQVPAAWGFDISSTKTEAGTVDATSEDSPLRMDFKAELRGGLPDVVDTDVVATWEQAGGVDPIPFIVTIPAGCFVADRTVFYVEDFRTCGVTIDLDRQSLPIVDFGARLILREDGTSRFDLGALFSTTPDDGAPVVLGVLGGAVVDIVIGTERSESPPLSVETVGATTPDDS